MVLGERIARERCRFGAGPVFLEQTESRLGITRKKLRFEVVDDEVIERWALAIVHAEVEHEWGGVRKSVLNDIDRAVDGGQETGAVVDRRLRESVAKVTDPSQPGYRRINVCE